MSFPKVSQGAAGQNTHRTYSNSILKREQEALEEMPNLFPN